MIPDSIDYLLTHWTDLEPERCRFGHGDELGFDVMYEGGWRSVHALTTGRDWRVFGAVWEACLERGWSLTASGSPEGHSVAVSDTVGQSHVCPGPPGEAALHAYLRHLIAMLAPQVVS